MAQKSENMWENPQKSENKGEKSLEKPKRDDLEFKSNNIGPNSPQSKCRSLRNDGNPAQKWQKVGGKLLTDQRIRVNGLVKDDSAFFPQNGPLLIYKTSVRTRAYSTN